MTAFEHAGGGLQVAQTGIGTRANEYVLNGCLSNEITGFEILIVKCALGSFFGNRIAKRIRRGEKSPLFNSETYGQRKIGRKGLHAGRYSRIPRKKRMVLFEENV